ncbi:MAG TPA: OB-fold domain-containing protein [Galbitalea sp.]|jgi:hypothetical protein
MVNVPLQAARGEEAHFYDELAAGRIAYQVCDGCAEAVWYPRAVCPNCGTARLVWRQSAGRGTVYSYTVLERAGHPARRDDVPYAVALIDLDEGIRVLGNLALAGHAESAASTHPIGRAVTASIVQAGDGDDRGVATMLFTITGEAA